MSDPSNLEHLDEVVSAYVDGEATPEEVRLVEADPALMEQVELMRGLVEMDQVVATPDPEMKRRHLAAAMAAFDAPADTGSGSDSDAAVAPVVDLTPPPADTPPAETNGSAPVIDLTSRRRGPAGMPRILTAAAGVLVVLGGIGFVATQNDSGDATAVADTDQVSNSRPSDADEDGGEAAGAEASDDAEAMEDDDAMEDETSALADEAMAEDAMEDDSSEEESAVDQDTSGAVDEDSSADDTAPASDEDDELTSPLVNGPFVDVFPETTLDELLALTDGIEGQPLELSLCNSEFAGLAPETFKARSLFDSTQDAQWFPALIDNDITGEFVVVTGADGERAGVLFDDNCNVVER